MITINYVYGFRFLFSSATVYVLCLLLEDDIVDFYGKIVYYFGCSCQSAEKEIKMKEKNMRGRWNYVKELMFMRTQEGHLMCVYSISYAGWE